MALRHDANQREPLCAKHSIRMPTCGRGRNLRPALTIAAGLVARDRCAVVLGSLVAHTRRGNRGIRAPARVTNDAAKPHFERSDEPATEDSLNAHGG
jgi:hypothetical protein